MKKLINLVFGDFKNITRDSMLLVSIFAPILLAVSVKLSFPFIEDMIFNVFSINLVEYYEVIMSFIILLSPFMLGVMVGLMILDEKDENILAYIAVTPMSKAGYLLYRLLSPMFISFICTVFIIEFTGLVTMHSKVWLVLLLVTMLTPIVALFLGVFAKNKVEGLTITKAAGILLFVPIVPFFIASKWALLAGVFPTYWISKAFVESFSTNQNYIGYLSLGFFVNGMYLYILWKRFNHQQA